MPKLINVYVWFLIVRFINLNMCWYILLIFGIWIIVSFLTHRFLARSKKNMMIKDINKKSSNVMFVIAHPDDECMFFGPAITSMTQPVASDHSVGRRKAKHVYLLCLSDGNLFNHSTPSPIVHLFLILNKVMQMG